jgi:predicted enzyme related to lactoylglutathione lyase
MGHTARVELVLDCAEPERLATFWRQALDYREYYTDAHLVVLVPMEGMAAPLLLQGVPEPKAGKNRMHLDIVADDIDAEVHRLQGLGAHRIDDDVQSFGGTRWVRMSDPEQNEFCVSTGVDWETPVTAGS